MITYELAKKLKDAGFPQNIEHGGHFYYDSMPSNFIINNTKERALDEPTTKRTTLSELIEACGDRFEALIKQAGGWVAIHNYESYVAKNAFKSVNSPEEAVANLWLALNEKK